jgi:hypothetical protein
MLNCFMDSDYQQIASLQCSDGCAFFFWECRVSMHRNNDIVPEAPASDVPLQALGV